MKNMNKETRTKIAKTLKGALIAGGGVAVTYFIQALGQIDFGAYSPLVAAFSSVIINAVKEFLRSYNE